ncbi:MAG: hypothetical protein ACKOWW_03260 [Flavobacteriales bacterium]
MRQRLVLLIISSLAFIWVLFASYDILSNETLTDFRSYFSAKDKKVWIIREASEFEWDKEGVQTTELNQNLYYSVTRAAKYPVTIFFSATRTLFLIEKKGNWNTKEVRQLFENGLFPLQLGKLKTFEFGKLHGQFNKNQLLIYEGELDQPINHQLQLNTKSSYSWITWQNNIAHVTDTYVKAQLRYRYEKYRNTSKRLKKVDDYAIFAEAIPDFLNSYYFYEKNYAAQLDPSFEKTPWYRCMKTGFVHLKKDSSSLLVFDFNENANPLLMLNEALGKEELNEETQAYENLQVSKLIESKKNTWHVGTFGTYAFASTDKALFDQALAAAKLNQTIAQDTTKMVRFYENMPKKVSARWVDARMKKTLTLLGKDVVITSYLRLNEQLENDQDKIRDYFVMNPGSRVLNFASFSERGNVILQTENQKLVGYINGLRKWEKPLNGEVKNIYALAQLEQLIVVQFAHEAQLYDKSGRLVYRLTHEAGTEIGAYDINGKKEFLCANGSANLQLINENGATIKQFAIGGQLKDFAVYKQNGKPQVSILTDKQFTTIDLAKRKINSKQTVDSTYVLAKTSSSVAALQVKKNQVILLLQGAKKQFQVPNGVQFMAAYKQGANTICLFNRNAAVYAFDQLGNRLWEKTLPLKELSKCQLYQYSNGQSCLVFLDAIGNQIHLLDDLGRDLDRQDRHGEEQIAITRFGSNAYSITTYLGTYLIQYTKQ